MNRMKTAMMVLMIPLSACDGGEDVIQEDERLASMEHLEHMVELEQWENGLEELLDTECDEAGCRWVWADLEAEGLDEIEAILPPLPEDLDGPIGRLDTTEWPSGPSDITTTAEAGGKTITITSIRCLDRQEAGGDEPYIVVDGVKRWSGSDFYVGDSNQLSVSKTYAWNAVVEVWENDPVYDDKIGQKTVTLATTNGYWSTTFYGSDAAYQIYYTISG